MVDRRPLAVVTGASRGIGRATAIALAESGMDVVVTGRTVTRSDRDPSPVGDSSQALPGSLEETIEAIEAAGGRGWPVRLDLLEDGQAAEAAVECLEAMGRVDVLVNNAIWTGDGNFTRFLDTDLDDVVRRIDANLSAQLIFTQPILAAMVRDGGGVVLNVTSGAAYAQPFALPGEGGWGLGYAVSKAGLQRVTEQLAYEYANDGISALNVQPGFVATERVKLLQGPVANVAEHGSAPAAIGVAIAHVAANPGEYEAGSTVQLYKVAKSLGLLGN